MPTRVISSISQYFVQRQSPSITKHQKAYRTQKKQATTFFSFLQVTKNRWLNRIIMIRVCKIIFEKMFE